jgi:Leucine-rich repeat (LRR) protein
LPIELSHDVPLFEFPDEIHHAFCKLKLPDYLQSLTSLSVRLLLFAKCPVTLPREQFRQLPRITDLDLAGNHSFTAESFEAIGELVSLRHLSLEHLDEIHASTIRPGSLTNLRHLQFLIVNAKSYDTGLTTIPSDFYELTSLTVLSLRGNKITAIEPNISRLTNLRCLDLSENELSGQLQPTIGALTTLEVLFLNDNRLTAIPPSIGLLTNLWTLKLRDNANLRALPDEFGQLTQFTSFSLVDYYVIMPCFEHPEPLAWEKCHPDRPKPTRVMMDRVSLLQFLPSLTNLTDLALHRPEHVLIHGNISRLTKLQTVCIEQVPDGQKVHFSSRNRFDSSGALLPKELERMQKFVDNPLECDNEAVSPGLREYWQQQTSVSIPSFHIFNNNAIFFLPALSSLQLVKCGLTSIPPDLYHGCVNLTLLDLSGNELTFIDRSLIIGTFHYSIFSFHFLNF